MTNITREHLRELVYHALNCAYDNGYTEQVTMDPAHVAEELMAYDADISDLGEYINEETLLPHIITWQNWKS